MCGCSSRTLAADRARLSLIEPLGTRARLELFGERNVIDGDEAQSVYDLESGTPEASISRTFLDERAEIQLTGLDPLNHHSRRPRGPRGRGC
jgi:hypothetical protein